MSEKLDKDNLRVGMEIYKYLIESDTPLNINQITEKFDKHRTSITRTIKKLILLGFIIKEKHKLSRGFEYRYKPIILNDENEN